MTTKKKSGPKLKSQKLEERIAPGMLGGGIIDPGMADATIDSSSEPTTSGDGTVSSTQYEQVSTETSSGQYVDENVASADSQSLSEPTLQAETPVVEGAEQFDQPDEFQSNDAEQFSQDQGAWAEADWVTQNPDGSFHVTPPAGVQISDGVANFPLEVANAELPLPEGLTLEADGSAEMTLPEGTEYSEELNAIMIPQDQIDMNHIPEDVDAYVTPDNMVCIALPEDVSYNAESNSLEISNEVLNQMAPENVQINMDGSVAVELPSEGVTYNADGSFDITPEASAELDHPAPAYCPDEYSNVNADGSITMSLPDSCEVEGGVATLPNEAIAEFIPAEYQENLEFNADGTMSVSLPEGAVYNADYSSLTLPEGSVSLSEIPESIPAHVNPDMSITATLPEGCIYSAEANSITFSNEATNEILPNNIHLNEDGSMSVALPQGCEYYEDGSFTIPAEQTEFISSEAPAYVADCSFVQPVGDGAYTCTPPAQGFELNQQEGTLTVQNEYIEQLPLPENFEINADGSSDLTLDITPQYEASSNSLIFPAEAATDIPEQIQTEVLASGDVKVYLPDGISYDAADNSVHMDNYWTNELTPSCIEVSPEGNIEVSLPNNCEYNANGSFTIPESSADFIQEPAPEYLAQAPEFVTPNPDGSYTFEPTQGLTVQADEGICQLNPEFVQEHFENSIPEDVSFNPDGTMNVQVPEGTLFDANAGTLNFPVGTVHMNEIPEGIQATLNDNGSISLVLPEGMNYDAASGAVHMDSYWTNEMMPEPVSYTAEGQFEVVLPSDTYYHQDGSFTIPEQHSDFMENPEPSYAQNGPEWVSENPDGSITISVPEGGVVDATAGTYTMSHDLAMEAFSEEMHDMTFNLDGSATISLPEGSQYIAGENALLMPMTEINPSELPQGIQYEVQGEAVKVFLPEGISYSDGSVTLNNQWVNEVVPEPITVTNAGEFVVTLPPDTQYFNVDGQSSFVISSESADFIDDQQSYQQSAPMSGTQAA